MTVLGPDCMLSKLTRHWSFRHLTSQRS